jgi:2-phosphoglycerate kinase
VTERRHREPLPLGGEDGLPFSKGLLARSLIATGVQPERSWELAIACETDLTSSGNTAVTLDRFSELAVETLGEDEGGRVTRRLRLYRRLSDLDLPIILLVGGATGTGKSTVATEVAYRLGVTRVTSTDFVRQTMRAFFSKDFMPSIHYSSFEAGRAALEADEPGDPVLHGFLDQTRNVLVGVNAAIERALEEGWSMVLEGVHLVPGMVPTSIEGALVVQFVLAIRDLESHASHFWSRDRTTEGVRPFERYLDSLGNIRLIQDFIVERARRTGVPVIENANIEEAIGRAMELVLESAERAEAVGG